MPQPNRKTSITSQTLQCFVFLFFLKCNFDLIWPETESFPSPPPDPQPVNQLRPEPEAVNQLRPTPEAVNRLRPEAQHVTYWKTTSQCTGRQPVCTGSLPVSTGSPPVTHLWVLAESPGLHTRTGSWSRSCRGSGWGRWNLAAGPSAWKFPWRARTIQHWLLIMLIISIILVRPESRGDRSSEPVWTWTPTERMRSVRHGGREVRERRCTRDING